MMIYTVGGLLCKSIVYGSVSSLLVIIKIFINSTEIIHGDFF